MIERMDLSENVHSMELFMELMMYLISFELIHKYSLNRIDLKKLLNENDKYERAGNTFEFINYNSFLA